MKRTLIGLTMTFAMVLATPLVAEAHVVVTPNQVGVGSTTSFSVAVPNERNAAVSSIKLIIPSDMQDVVPDVAGGWDITTDSSGDTVTSITWGGVIPIGQRADLRFSAQAPSTARELDWKAYQTYADGTVVSWDQKPVANDADYDAATSGPYSVTQVVDDIGQTSNETPNTNKQTATFVLSIIALVFSILALVWRRRRA